MNRVLAGMAAANYVLVALVVYLGYLSDPAADPSTLGDGAFRYHFPLGILTAIYTLLVHCMVFTYFLGTNRWVKETAAAYDLDRAIAHESRRCRSRAFAVAIASMLMVVATVATGAGAHTKAWPTWLHQVVPLAAYGLMLFAYRIEYTKIEEHLALTDRVMDEVRRIRSERGLPVD